MKFKDIDLPVKWSNYYGIVDRNGKQILQLLQTSPRRLRVELGKFLVKALNEQNKRGN